MSDREGGGGREKALNLADSRLPSQIRALYSGAIMPAECYNFGVFIAVTSWQNALRVKKNY